MQFILNHPKETFVIAILAIAAYFLLLRICYKNAGPDEWD